MALTIAAAGCKRSSIPADDATLTHAAQARINSDATLAAEPIQASVQDGVATLTGSVSSDTTRSAAAADVAEIAGIRTVVNDLAIVIPGSAHASQHRKANGGDRGQKLSASITPPHLMSPQTTPQSTSVPREQQSAAPIERAAAPDSPPLRAHTPPKTPFRSFTLEPDTTLPIRINQTLDSATTHEGDTFSGVIASDILTDGVVVLPEGTPVTGRVDTVHEAAHFKGSSLLTIELVSLDRPGDPIHISTDSFSKAGNGRGKNTAEKVGGGGGRCYPWRHTWRR